MFHKIKNLRKITALILVFAIFTPVARPISEETPRVAGIASFLALLAPSLYYIHKTPEGEEHEFTRRNVGFSAAALAGSALASYYLYRKLRSYTPQAKFASVQDIIEKAQKKLMRADIRQASDLIDELNGAIVLLDEISLEIQGREKYTQLSQDADRLYGRILQLFVDQAKNQLVQVERHSKMSALLSEHASHLSQIEFISLVERMYGTRTSYQGAQNDLELANDRYALANKSLSGLIRHDKMTSSLPALYKEGASLVEAIKRQQQHVALRLRLLSNYSKYLSIHETLASFERERKLSWLARPAMSERDFVAHMRTLYSGQRWYASARDDLTAFHNRIRQSLNNVRSLSAEPRVQEYAPDLQQIMQTLRQYDTRLLPRTQLMDKVAVFNKAQTDLDNAISGTRFAPVIVRFQQNNRMSDGELWDWANTTYGRNWSRSFVGDVSRLNRRLNSLSTEIQRVLAMSNGDYLNTQIRNVRTGIDSLVRELQIIEFIARAFAHYQNVSGRFDRFVDQTRLRRFLLARNSNPSRYTTLRMIREIFSDSAWPLVDAKPEFDRAISDLTDIRRRATQIAESTTSQTRRSLLVRTRQLEREITQKIDWLSDRRRQLTDSPDYTRQQRDKREYERTQQQRREEHRRRERERREREERERRERERLERERQNQQPPQPQGPTDTGGVHGGDECPICMDDFTANDRVIVTRCAAGRHLFHETELRDWLRAHNTCPLCRTQNPGTETMTYADYVRRFGGN